MPANPPPFNVWRYVEDVIGPGFWNAWLSAVHEAWAYVPDAIPTSWYRTQGENARLGGAPNSQHLWGLAGDFAVPGAGPWHQTNADANQLASALRARGFTVIVESDHVHFQTF